MFALTLPAKLHEAIQPELPDPLMAILAGMGSFNSAERFAKRIVLLRSG